jgi:hypothetical protein
MDPRNICAGISALRGHWALAPNDALRHQAGPGLDRLRIGTPFAAILPRSGKAAAVRSR